ncbi:MAG: methyltransferase domain-containing protein [Solirubrobacterales bacterium]|nr:methyltransferase domain-containing protein [Solirubrobacterales bacterium]
MIHRAASAGFQRSADAYDRARPEYPPEAIAWLWAALALTDGAGVIDVGAGTGKLTRPLSERGAEVVAVEPVEAMRRRIAGAAPKARVLAGTAERLPVGDATSDVVVAGQAFHWFANEDALSEFYRALRPGGRLGLVWNRRRLDQPLQAAISDLLEPVRGDAPRHASNAWRAALEGSGSPFAPVGEHEVDFEQSLDEDGLVDRVGSISFVAALADDEGSALLARVRELGRAHAPIRLAYTSEAFAYRART